MKRFWITLGLLCATGAGLAACGEDAEDDTTAGAQTEDSSRQAAGDAGSAAGGPGGLPSGGLPSGAYPPGGYPQPGLPDSGESGDHESYAPGKENRFLNAQNRPLSTFAVDVDTASYANVRRFITQGSKPPAGAVRLEELINYFNYDYPAPTGEDVISVVADVGPSPFHADYSLARVAVKAKELQASERPASNLVFLLDVSGSMSAPNKLPLVQRALRLVVEQLTEDDRISIVTYAGADRIALRPTTGDAKATILAAVEALQSGGSTHASSGIQTAYELAEQTMKAGENTRIILATDGDFNVGITSQDALQTLIEDKRKTGIYLTVLGFGTGNIKDDTMELLADKGNGNYAYIDSLVEAKKVLVTEMGGTFFTVGKDVKIQVDFNPAKVGAYRLLGYENRLLDDEDFQDDKKDGGEMGAGHTVTALYELIPAGHADVPKVSGSDYQEPVNNDKPELLTVKLRYKPKGSETSTELSTKLSPSTKTLDQLPADFRFAAAVAGFGMLLKDSEYKGGLDWAQCATLAEGAKGADAHGYRAELVQLVKAAAKLK